jgi:hypothetical protein
MNVDKAWGDQQPLGIDFFGGSAGDYTDLLNDAVNDFDIAHEGRGARAVSNQAITNN